RVALERDVGVLLGVEEVRRTEVAVALGVVRVDGPDVDGDLEVGLLRRGRVQLQPAAHATEPAADGAHHHVLHREVDLRVRGIDVPEHVFPLMPLPRRLVAGTINSLPTQPIPKTRRRLSEAEIRAWEAFVRAYATTSHVL